MDVRDLRVAKGVERFIKGEYELFGLPRRNVAQGKPCPPLTVNDSYSFCSFCVHLAVNSYNIAVHGYGDAVTEGYSERGFDGIAIAFEDIPLDSPETARRVAEAAISEYKDSLSDPEPMSPPNVRILMIQVKMKGSAKTDELDSLGGSAYRFLTMPDFAADMSPNDMVMRWWHIYDEIRKVYERNDVAFTPELDLLFIYQGDKNEEDPLNTWACEAQQEILSDKLQQDKVNFKTWRIDEIIEAIALADQAVDGVLAGAQLLRLPEARAVGYIGYAPAKSIADMIPKVKILGDKRLRPDERVFADNIRSFTGDLKNPGAVALRKTLVDGEADQVILRHNGITIVTRDAKMVPREDGSFDVELKAYQIVNGAQSSFILQRNCELLANAFIPIKIVVTEEDEIKDGVVLGANLQSQISPYDMLARKKEIRALQQAFESIDYGRPDKLWFQRRRGERFPNRVEHSFQILTPRQLLEAFVAAIEGMPHTVHTNAGKLINKVPDSIFCSNHHPSVYRALGWLVAAGRHWADHADMDWVVEGPTSILSMNRGKNLYIPRHHFIYAMWRLIDPNPDDVDVLQGKLARNSEKVEARFESICEQLCDRNAAIEFGNRAARAVELAREDSGPIGGEVRKLPFTRRLRKTVQEV